MTRLIEKIYFRVRSEDKEKINAKAQQIGLTPSAFIRMAALSYSINDSEQPSVKK
jgi:antitoxin component of RelBE/YafQ-DinJ toxin-antitoxin module